MSRAPNWRPDEDALLDRRIPDSEVARLTGRELNAIWLRRTYLRKKGLLPPPASAPAPAPKARPMAPAEQLLHPQYAKPRGQEPKVARDCLRCRKSFLTTRYVRVCGRCKQSEDWS